MCFSRRPNQYLISTRSWVLHDDMHEDMLGLAGLRVAETRDNERRLPDELRPANMPLDRGHPWPATVQAYLFERPRDRITGHGARDRLTVTLSDCVDRTWWGFKKYATEGWPLDADAVCAAMDLRRTYTNVRKIRLIRSRLDETYHVAHWRFQFVCQGPDNTDEIKNASRMFKIYTDEGKDALARRLVAELKLTHAVVDGVDEFSVA
jgi:hypothetical protein